MNNIPKFILIAVFCALSGSTITDVTGTTTINECPQQEVTLKLLSSADTCQQGVVRTGKKGPRGDVGMKGSKGEPAQVCDCMKNTQVAQWMDTFRDASSEIEELNRERIFEHGEANTISVRIVSKGYLDGNTAHIYVNDEEIPVPFKFTSFTRGRGFCIVVIDPVTKAVVSEGFDLLTDWNSISRMNKYIDNIPNGSIVAVAMKDAVSNTKNIVDFPEARRGLDNLGGGRDGCPYGVFRDSWALLTMKVDNLGELPTWFACHHQPAESGYAEVSAEINTRDFPVNDMQTQINKVVSQQLHAVANRLELLEDKINEILQAIKK